MQVVRTLFNLEELQEITSLLEENEIAYTVEEDNRGFENIYTSNPEYQTYKLLVEDNIAEKTFEIINNYYNAGSSVSDDENYLKEYEDDELVEIMVYPQQYSYSNQQAAKKILLERYSEQKIQELIDKKIKADNTPLRVSIAMLIGLYCFGMIGSILGCVAGLYLANLKVRHTVTKEKYYAHDKYTRRHGWILFVVSLLSLPALFAFIYGVQFFWSLV